MIGQPSYDIMKACRQAGAAGGLPFATLRTEAKGGVHMSDYELIIIILTFLALLIAVDSKNKR